MHIVINYLVVAAIIMGVALLGVAMDGSVEDTKKYLSDISNWVGIIAASLFWPVTIASLIHDVVEKFQNES